ncbi:DNA methyltransferase [Trueperella bialowiezensis]|uniref:site-specific DNA-methyltransferase (adenine-specific) n=1 Tax=Trueperella bialowiezensis TaxID=312285 RepID=A0A448PDR7_9ACTO|nr:DNA methyltransferase [Trueperella bialowiezensis]VEI13070.1 Type I restriction-modification system methyltransferase subunit [Trueperella bialowiezensis]
MSAQATGSTLTETQRRHNAQAFAQTWRGRGYEKGDTQQFWGNLLRSVMGVPEDQTVTGVRYEEGTSRRGFIDVIIPDAKTLIEQKSIGVDLDRPEMRQGQMVTPFEQALNYANSLPNSQRPDYIIVCNFEEFRIHNLDQVKPEENYLSFRLEELPEQYHLLDFLINPANTRRYREEQVSMDAGVLIGELYHGLREQYIDPDSERSQHSLNVLCVRLVFCLFAEDAGIFAKDSFHYFLANTPHDQVRTRLLELFQVLDTPEDERDPYLSADLKAFPYVNGGLFDSRTSGPIEIPLFTEELYDLLVNRVSRDTNWAEISPTIFGGVFESTLNPETRASGGMHYTSPENIHKVIDPLFLDDLTAELQSILTEFAGQDVKRKNRLRAFHDKIAGLTFFDPACGSGNFLTETYISLRRLENKVLSELTDQTELAFGDITPLKVSLDQFYGIEINDFAVSVASTAMWIAELQANIEAQTIVTQLIDDLPLSDSAHIVQGNALRTDWAEILPPEKCDYIIGNPPFLGYSRLNADQKEERLAIFGKGGSVLDYVACWHRKAAEYMEGTECEAALVSTNSICQGQQVAPLWEPLFEMGISINFAHRSFSWANEATDQAQVTCVIIGFSHKERTEKYLWDYRRATAEERAAGSAREIGTRRAVDHINAYLADAPDVFIQRRGKPLSDVPEMKAGGKPTEGNFLLLSPDEKAQVLAAEPDLEEWIRPFSMGQEFINGKDRYCFWLVDTPRSVIAKSPILRERVQGVRDMRLASTKKATQKKAETPWLFDEIRYAGSEPYIAVPAVSSERRRYIPLGFVANGMIPGNQLYFIPSNSLFIFGVMCSQFHNSFMRAVAGRLELRYRYANTIVYNNFVFPDPTAEQREAIENAAQAVLDAREEYPEATLADLYDPDNSWLYPELTRAHEQLDRAVEAAYGVDYSEMDDSAREAAIVAHLFELYAQAAEE